MFRRFVHCGNAAIAPSGAEGMRNALTYDILSREPSDLWLKLIQKRRVGCLPLLPFLLSLYFIDL
jgi:hypothetical protein